jgi:hypothetical protein
MRGHFIDTAGTNKKFFNLIEKLLAQLISLIILSEKQVILANVQS